MIRVRWIDVYTAYEPTRVVRRRWQRIESGVRNGTCSGIGVFRDEQASCACSNPQGICVARGTFNRGNAAHACSTCAKPIATVSGAREISRTRRPDLDKVTAPWLVRRSCELRTISFESCLISAPILCTPNALGSLVNRTSVGCVRVSNNGRVKECRLRTRNDWRRDDHPL